MSFSTSLESALAKNGGMLFRQPLEITEFLTPALLDSHD
jgi:hypothetical protein